MAKPMTEWHRATKKHPCKVCQKADWCTWQLDGSVCCNDSKYQWRAIIADYTVMSVSGAIAALSIPKMLYSSLMNPEKP